jgi:hypothetical protein
MSTDPSDLLLGQSVSPIPVDLYGGDDGDIAWVPHVKKAEAVALAVSWWGEGDFPIRARRCYLRWATPEESDAHGWEHPGAVILCERGEPGAVRGWEVGGDA